MKKLAVLLAGVTSLLVIGLMPLGSAVTYAASATANEVCNGIGITSTDPTGSSTCGDQGAAVNNAVSVIINIVSAVVGLIAVIMIIIAGVRFVTSGGDPAQVKGAKSALIYAIVGIVIVALAQLIVHTVISDVIQ
jgi:hypothetical protein